VRRLAADAPKAMRVTDKMPRNFFFLGLIPLALPKARIVHCVRDPVDTCLSCFKELFSAGHAYSYDLGDLGRHYRSYLELMDHWKRVLPGYVHDLVYEDLIADPETVIRNLLDFAGLPWEGGCLRFHETERPVRTASLRQVRQPLYGTSVKRWRRYERHLAPLLDALGPLASER